MATCNGWHPANGNGYRPTRPAQPAAPQPQAPSGGPPEPPAPPPPPTSAGAPPAPAEQAQGSGGNGNGGEFMVEFVKVVAPKGKPVIEFWRPNRKWAEIKYYLGGERFLELAPMLTEAGWVAAHFDDVGKEYPLALTVTWEPSQDGKYKDITAVHLRQ